VGTSSNGPAGELEVVVLGAYEGSNIALDVGLHDRKTAGPRLVELVCSVPLVIGWLFLLLLDVGNAAEAAAWLVAVSAVLVAVVLVAMRVRARLILRRRGRLWCSRPAPFVGPHDETTGLVGSLRFEKRHSAEALVPMVRVAIGPDGFELIPERRRRRDILRCGFADLSSVDVVDRGRGRRGMTLYLHGGRRATIAAAPTGGCIEVLESLGARVRPEAAPPFGPDTP
jgi:hypothetical protein